MNDAIAAVHSEDVQKARLILQRAIRQAGDVWLPSEAIVDALTLELIDMAGRRGHPDQVAARLRQLATLLGHRHDRTH
jgi:hypothetical protein